MKISAEGTIIEIEDVYIQYSPMLNTLAMTGVGADRIDDAYIMDTSLDMLENYANFLREKPFTMSDDDAEFFDFMGHENRLRYPLDFWKVKLRDNWIRDNFHRLNLPDIDPYCGLVEIPIVNKVDIPLTDGVYAAGGVALYMTGCTSSFKDIDLFCTSKDAALKYLSWLDEDTRIHTGPNTIGFKGRQLNGKFNTTKMRYGRAPDSQKSSDFYADEIGGPYKRCLSRTNFQLILRLYTSPSEIVHGFDLDCVGVLYDGAKLWATERACYSIFTKVNWFDPARASPSYAYRLSKYRIRGFDIHLPLFEKDMIVQERIDKLWSEISKLYDRIDCGDCYSDPYEECIEYMKIPNLAQYIREIANILEHDGNLHSIGNVMELLKGLVFVEYGAKIHICNTQGTKGQRKKLREIIPRDAASILILASVYHIHTCVWSCSDYESNENNEHMHKKIGDAIANIVWIEQNPGAQVSSTFYPTPIFTGNSYHQQDLIDWYKKCPLLGPMPVVPKKKHSTFVTMLTTGIDSLDL